MRQFLRLLVPVMLLATMASGCLGTVEAIYVPQHDLAPDWDQTTDNETQEAAKGAVDIVINRYAYEGQMLGEIYMVAVTDIPAFDEEAEVKRQIEQQATANGVALEQVRTFEEQLDNGETVQVTEYSIEKDGVSGMAWAMGWDAGSFRGGALGWATTEHPGLLGSDADESVWTGTKDMLRAADW